MEIFVTGTLPFVGSNQITLITPIALNGASSAKRVRVDVIQIHNVKAPSSVALTTVQVDHQTWTAVQVKKIENLLPFKK